jgi:hypothetical protein
MRMRNTITTVCLLAGLSVCGCRTAVRVPLSGNTSGTPWEDRLKVGQEQVGETRYFFLECIPTSGARTIGQISPKNKLYLAWHRGDQSQGFFFRPGEFSQFQLEPGFNRISFELSPQHDPHIFVFQFEGQNTYHTEHVFASRDFEHPELPEEKVFSGDFDDRLKHIIMDTYWRITKTHNN